MLRPKCKKEPAMPRAFQTEAIAGAKALRCKHYLKMPGTEGRPVRLDQSENSHGGSSFRDEANGLLAPPRDGGSSADNLESTGAQTLSREPWGSERTDVWSDGSRKKDGNQQ